MFDLRRMTAARRRRMRRDMNFDLRAYCDRVGYDGPAEPTLAVLRRLQGLHPLSIPFENLDALAGIAPVLDLQGLQAKLVGARRGGWCFEHNALFAAALETIGFKVERLIARVRWGLPPGGAATPRTHMLLRVTIDDEPWLADVGAVTLTGPLRFELDTVQETPHGLFRLQDADGEWEQQAKLGETWTAAYRFDLKPAELVDYEVGNWFCATNPGSIFTQTLIASRVAPEERLSLTNNDFVRRRLDGAVERRYLGSGREISDVLGEAFGIDPPEQIDYDAFLAPAPF
jgi:N-hydroxyarylamine O-acetyltransferase